MKINYITNIINKNSSASINRITLFKKGIMLNGVDCAIHFTDVGNISNTYLKKTCSFFKIFKVFIRAEKNEIFIFYGKSFYYLFILIFKWKFKFFVERTEYPDHLINQRDDTTKGKSSDKFFNKLLKYTDGFITCSNYLKEYYSQFFEHKNIHISPLIVDIDKFEKVYNDLKYDFNYIAYIGSLGNNKDGVPNLINSFSLIENEFNDLKLLIIGNTNVKEFDEIKQLVIERKIEPKVIFTGLLNHEFVPSILKSASLLVLARPDNKQAEGGIPSKIGEYMASKVPMVVTDVGELTSFLKDGYNCFIAKPNSIDDFASKMKVALNYEDKKTIINNAFTTVKKFDVLIQSKKLIDFLSKN